MTDSPDLHAPDLYALSPEEFTAARDSAAKVDKSLKALRRPSVSAWVVNTLVRGDPVLLEQLLALGAELAQAQRDGQGAALRELGEQRRQLVEAVTERAVELAGRALSAASRAEVTATLEAALADPPSADAVRTGQLVRALAFAGFGGVDLDGAVADLPARPARAATSAKPRASAETPEKAPATPAGPSRQVQRLETAALTAQGALDDAVRLAERTGRELAAAQAVTAAAEQDLAATEQMLQQARAALAEAEREHSRARTRRSKAKGDSDELVRKVERASKAVGTAQDASDGARAALDQARRS